MKRDFYADLHDDIIDDEYDNSENISTSQASPIRHPEVTSKSGTRYIFFHNRRRKHHLPSWMIKLQHLDWWGKHDGEYSLGRIQRRLDALLICPPVKIMSHYRVLEINYFYLKIGFALVLPAVLFLLFKFPDFYIKFFWTGIYFFFLSLIYEFTALILGQWTFPAENQFIGYIGFGAVRFPLEELIFWIALGSVAASVYYALLHKKHGKI